jgi:hypothetical protein
VIGFNNVFTPIVPGGDFFEFLACVVRRKAGREEFLGRDYAMGEEGESKAS